ncbi:MAG: SycD/LcrH family type III secretion system chaperone [Deltaproteobacteria bacterium]|nr:SycD/LcrH family type III secretion system chaperone [Deltaproteobacteria bacterium]
MSEAKLDKELLANVEGIVQKVVSGKSTLQIELGITDKELEAVYAIGYTQYVNGKYEDAKKTFSILMMFNPLNYKYCFSLASAFKMLNDLETASLFYLFSCSLDPENPEPHLQLAECLVQLDDLIGAKENFERAIQIAGDKEAYTAVKNRAKMLLEGVEAKLKELEDSQDSQEPQN